MAEIQLLLESYGSYEELLACTSNKTTESWTAEVLELWLFILKSNDQEIEMDLNCIWAGPALKRSLISSWKLSYEPPPPRTDGYANVHWEIKKNCGAWNWLISALCVSARARLESTAPISKTLQNILYQNKRRSASGLVSCFMVNWWERRVYPPSLKICPKQGVDIHK